MGSGLMASAWGSSWGTSWGDAWGVIGVPDYVPVPSPELINAGVVSRNFLGRDHVGHRVGVERHSVNLDDHVPHRLARVRDEADLSGFLRRRH